MKPIAVSIKFPLSLLKMVGLHYDIKPALLIVNVALYTITIIICMVLIALQFSNVKGNTSHFAGNTEAFFTLGQLAGKLVLIAYHGGELRNVVEATRSFREVSKCKDYQIIELVKGMRWRIALIQRIFLMAVITATTCAILAVFFGGTLSLPLGVWTLNSDFGYYILLTLQLALVYPLAILMCAINGIFIAICIEIIVQLQPLCFTIRALSNINITRKLNSCALYHAFLLKLFKDLTLIYSPVLALEYITSTLLLCTEMYILSESKNVSVLMRNFVSCCTVFLQISFYCIPVEYVKHQALAVAQAVYDIPWYDWSNAKTLTMMLVIMKRSQKEVPFLAAGAIVINLGTLLTMMKASWAAYNVLRAIKG